MVVGSSFRKIVTNPEHEKALITYGAWTNNYVDPSFRYCDLYDERLQDSIRVVVYDVVDFESFLSPDLTGSWVKEEYANFVWDRRDSAALLATIPLSKDFFPTLDKKASPLSSRIADLGFVEVGPKPAQLFRAEAHGASMGVGAASSSTHQAFWRWDEQSQRYIPIMTSLIHLGFNEFHGAQFDADYNFTSDPQVEDIDGDGVNELTQRRTFWFGAGTVHTTCSDPGRVVLSYIDGQFVATRMHLANGKSLKIHREIPFIVLPKWDSTQIPIPEDDEMSARVRLIENSVRRHNILQIPVMSDTAPAIPTPTPNSPSCSFDLSSDSLSIEVRTVQRGQENQDTREHSLKSVLALWFDSDLSGDPDDSTLSEHDFLLAVRVRAEDKDTLQTVEKYRVRDSHGDASLELISRGPSILRLTGRSPVNRITLPIKECGLASREGRPAICGFAVEVFDSDMLFRNSHAKAAAAYPPTFLRFDPRTWGALIVADRTDSIIVNDTRH